MRSDTTAANTFRAIQGRLILPAMVLALTTASFILAKAARDSLYFEGSGIADLPWAYLGVAVLAWPVGMTALALMRRTGRGFGRILILLSVSSLNLLLALLARPGGGALMTAAFMAVPLFYGVALSTGWLLGAELLDRTSTSRPDAYGFLGSASMAGGVIGALLAGGIAPAGGPKGMFAAAALALIAAMIATRRAVAREGTGEGESGPQTPPAASRPVALLKNAYTLWLLALAGLGGAVGILIEFQFYLAATETVSDPGARTAFFARFYTALMLGGFVFQVFMVPRIQRRIGVRGSLMILPLVLAGASAALAFGATALGQGGLRVAEGGLRSSIHRSTWEQVYFPFRRGLRDAAKILIDGMGARLAEGMTALALLFWVTTRPPGGLELANAGWMSYTVAAGALLWTIALWRVRMPAPGQGRRAAAPKAPPEGCVITATLGRCLWKGPARARQVLVPPAACSRPARVAGRRHAPWTVNTS